MAEVDHGQAVGVAKVLLLAAEMVGRPFGWGQGLYNKDGCFCIVGAIAAAANCSAFGVDIERPDLLEPVQNVLGLPTKIGGCCNVNDVFDWNDEDGRTQEQVVDALRRAAALATAKTATGPV